MSKYAHMTTDEIYSHIDKFGSEDEKCIADALYDASPEIDYSCCPYCDDADTEIGVLEQKIIDALQYLKDDNLLMRARMEAAIRVLS